MKIIFTLLGFSLALNSFGQQKPLHPITKSTGCSVIQESANLEVGYPSDYYQYMGLDDFIVPANECWSIKEITANFFQKTTTVDQFEYYFDVYVENPVNSGNLEYYNGSYSPVGNYNSTDLGNISTGLTDYARYQLDFNLEESIELCGGATSTRYWISIYSENSSQSTTTIWEVDTNQAANYGLNALLLDPDDQSFYNSYPGADFVFEINHRSYSTDTRTECSPYTWIDGNDYNSGVQHVEYIVPGGGSTGCDSVVFLNLTINNPVTSIDYQTACNSYTWIDGHIYTSSNNTAQFVLSNAAANGCDSIITLNLTLETVTSSITENADGSFSAGGGTSFQWINCATNSPIPGETNAVFTPTVNGNYAVIAYNANSNCLDTSACMLYDHVGLGSLSAISMSVFPNPATESMTITFNAEEAQLNLYDEQGRLTFTSKVTSGKTFSINEFAKGVYRIELLTNQGIVSERFVKM